MNGEFLRGEIVLVDFNPTIGHEQGNVRPAIIIQNNLGNKYSPILIVAAITSKIFDKVYSTNVFISKEDSKLNKDSTILLNQIRSIDKKRVINRISILKNSKIEEVNQAIAVSLGLEL